MSALNDDDGDVNVNRRNEGGASKRFQRSRKEVKATDDDGQQSGSDDDAGSDGSVSEEDWNVDVLENPEEIQVDLELFNIEADDYFSAKHFLIPLLEGQIWGAADIARHLTEEISAQIGTTIRVDGGREAYGFLSVLNLHRTAQMEATREIVRFLLSKITNKSQHQQLRQILESRCPLGLLLNERVVNVPGQIAPPLHMGFWEELEEAAENEQKDGVAKPYFDLEHYIMVTTVLETIPDDTVPRSKKARDSERIIEYLKPEDEVYIRNSTFAFSYPVTKTRHGRWTMSGTIRERKVIVLWHKSAIPNILHQLSELASNPDLYREDSPSITADDGFVNPLDDSSVPSSSSDF